MCLGRINIHENVNTKLQHNLFVPFLSLMCWYENKQTLTALLPQVTAAHVESMREHVFVVRVERVSGMTPLQSTVWGEADCYIQYSFPCQEGNSAADMDQNLIESSKAT